jgi:subfamily B ATP-binding cassette protein MsbA
MKAFMRILAYGKPFGRYWPSYLVLSVLSVLFGIANYALIAPLLTVLFEPDTLTGEIARPEYSFLWHMFQICSDSTWAGSELMTGC